MQTRTCRACGSAGSAVQDLGGRRTAFEAFEVPVDSLPSLRYAWAYVRHRGMICLNGRTRIPGRVMLRHRCDPTGWAQLKEVGAGWC